MPLHILYYAVVTFLCFTTGQIDLSLDSYLNTQVIMHFTYSRDTEMKATEFGFDQLGCNNSINYRFVLLADSAIRMLRRFPRS